MSTPIAVQDIDKLLDAFERGEKVKIPYDRGMGVRWARAYYRQQHPIRCALFGHKTSGIIDADIHCECFRCGGRFSNPWSGNPSVYEFFVLLPIYKIKKWLGIGLFIFCGCTTQNQFDVFLHQQEQAEDRGSIMQVYGYK